MRQSISQGSSLDFRATALRTVSSSSQNGINRQDGKCSVRHTNKTSLGGEKRHSDYYVNVVVVRQRGVGANTPND